MGMSDGPVGFMANFAFNHEPTNGDRLPPSFILISCPTQFPVAASLFFLILTYPGRVGTEESHLALEELPIRP